MADEVSEAQFAWHQERSQAAERCGALQRRLEEAGAGTAAATTESTAAVEAAAERAAEAEARAAHQAARVVQLETEMEALRSGCMELKGGHVWCVGGGDQAKPCQARNMHCWDIQIRIFGMLFFGVWGLKSVMYARNVLTCVFR